ncbi:hypothetical protein [Flavobacterium macrobrachii]|uniref:hypothetical protein n=1 Tax=Flavobacterium macrobrachii TaxID=591204 RepID=UPI003F72F85D
MVTLSDDFKEFQTTLNNKLSQEAIEHIFTLLTYLTIILPENNNALKNLYVLGNTCKVDIDFEVLKLKTSLLKNDGYIFRIEKLGTFLNNEMTKFVVESINKFIIDKNKYDLLEGINKTQFEMTLSLYDPIRVEFFNLKTKNEYYKTSESHRNDKFHKYEEYYEDFNPDLPFYDLPYSHIANREYLYYIIDDEHFGKFSYIENKEFYSEKTSIVHKYANELINNFEKLDEKEKKDIFLIVLFIAYLFKDKNKYSFTTLKWIFRNYNELDYREKVFNLYENSFLSDERIHDMTKIFRKKILFLKSHRTIIAILDTFIAPINDSDNISIGSLDVSNNKMLFDYVIFPLVEILTVYKNFHKNHMSAYKNSPEIFKCYLKSNNKRLWFLIENFPKIN